MSRPSDPLALDKLKARIQALRAKTIANGCTEGEALTAAAKVAELLDRYDLSLTEVELREAVCEQRAYETRRKKRIPLDECIGAVAGFCDCKVWREKTASGEARYVFFGLPADVEVALYLTELVDGSIRAELGRYKTTAEYQRFRHQERYLANASFALGMASSIADQLTRMKASRHEAARGTGRDLVVLKGSIVETELDRLDLKLRTASGPSRVISPEAYDAGGAVGASLAINPGLRDSSRAR